MSLPIVVTVMKTAVITEAMVVQPVVCKILKLKIEVAMKPMIAKKSQIIMMSSHRDIVFLVKKVCK